MKTIIPFLIMILALNPHAENQYTGSKAIVKSEFIYQKEDVPFPSCHASTIVETEEGLIAAWFGGTHEKYRDVGIWLSCFIDGNWTVPVEVANGVQHGNLRTIEYI